MPVRARARERGLTLLEIMAALVILTTVTLGTVSWVVSSVGLEAANEEAADATQVLRQVFEELDALPFSEIYARLDKSTQDDPGGPATARGGSFTIPAWQTSSFLADPGPVPSGAGASPGARTFDLAVTVEFPLDVDGYLSELPVDPTWGGTGWDMNADGEVTAGDRSADHVLLPVRVRMRWTGVRGSREIRATRLLGSRK